MICFVTNEILPTRRGGIGFYCEEAMAMLEAEGLETCLLVSIPEVDRRVTEEHLRSAGIKGQVFSAADYALPPRAGAPALHGAAALREPADAVSNASFGNAAYAASYFVGRALEDICRRLPVEVVEFIDYGGCGFVPIRRKRLLGDFSRQVLAVRVHGTAEAIRLSERRRYGMLTHLAEYYAEGYAVRHADVLIASTPSMLEEYNRLYGRLGSGVVSPLPVRKLTERPLPLRPVRRPPCKVYCVGTCLGHKAPEVFVEAGVRLLERGLEGVQFVVMGRDFPTSVRHGSYAEEMKRLVPEELKGRFEFRCTPYDAGQLVAAAKDAAFVALPARWEAFCLVAHELRWLGVPLVLSPIPPFRDCFGEGKDAAFTDGTVEGLADVMGRMLAGEIRLTGREDVESLYVTPGGFADVYRQRASALRAAAPEGEQASEAVRAEGMPLVSVIVASEDDAEPLRATVRSVLDSSYTNAEVLVVGSGTRASLEGLRAGGGADADGRVRLVGGRRGTRAAAYNAGLEEAAGEFVCCLPAGFRVSESYFGRAVGALRRRGELAYVSCFTGVCGAHPGGSPRGDGAEDVVFVEAPHGLDPVLVTVEDRTGLRGAVLRAEALRRHGLRYREDLFGYEDWELGWAMAEKGLAGEVLPEVHVTCDRQTLARSGPQKWLEQYHLLQAMAEGHPDLVRAHPAEVLKAHLQPGEKTADKLLTDAWLMQNYRGLRLLRVGLRKSIAEGSQQLLSHFWQKVTYEAAVLRQRIFGRAAAVGGRGGAAQAGKRGDRKPLRRGHG